jgi:hypothetical protein
MSLYDKIIALYPELKDTPSVFSDGTIILQNDSDGKGDYLAKWDHKTLEKPTDEQLA